MNYVDIILFHARSRPEHVALSVPGRVATYRQLGQGILSVERRLAELGAKPTDLVGIEIDDPIRHMIAICALFRRGIPSISLRGSGGVPLGPLGITWLLKDRPGGPAGAARIELIDDGWFSGQPLASGGGQGFANPNASCQVFLSSGTTGLPKAIAYSAAGIESRTRTVSFILSAWSWDRMLCMPGLTTWWGFVTVATALRMGRSVYFAPDAVAAHRLITFFNIDAVVASTQQLQILMDVQAQTLSSCASLRGILTGGSMLTRQFVDQVRSQLCPNVICSHGATEIGGAAHGRADQLRGIDGAAGFVEPWAEVEIIDEQGARCRPGEQGTVRIRADGHARSYNLPGAPKPSDDFRDGWFYPGDLGLITEDGILAITGRTEYIINAGGTKLAPETIESILQSHPDIADAGALGIANSLGVQEIWVAVVQRREISADAIIEFCRQRDPKMTPKQVRFVAAIPRNELAKVAREELRKLVVG